MAVGCGPKSKRAGMAQDGPPTSERTRLLLHVCCGPCSTTALERLLPAFEVTAFWHNPNIQPAEEWKLRFAAAERVAQAFGVELVASDPDDAAWLQAVAGHETDPEGGARCAICFEHRLRETVAEASRRGITHVATTLTVSPHKSSALINEIGARAAADRALTFCQEEFRKGGGFQRSVELSGQLKLHRQDYCGCLFTRRDQARRREPQQ